MVPAQERLGAAGLAVAEVDLRLVMQAELAPLERTAQLEAHLRARPGALVDLGGEELGGIASRLLGAIHRRVGSTEQGLGVVAVGGGGGGGECRHGAAFPAGGRRPEPPQAPELT